MPAEWESHEATWIAWPHHRPDWPGKFAPIPWVCADIVRHLSHVEEVRILVQPGEEPVRAKNILAKAGANLDAVEFHVISTDRIWTRDYAPIFVVRDEGGNRDVAVTNWRFSGWAKYANHELDDAVTDQVVRHLRLQQWKPRCRSGYRRIVLEGGSIDVNGQGLMLTTEECLLSEVQQRNPGVGRGELEQAFRDYLGVKKVIWLRNGIVGDDTHGHVDDLARFTDVRTVVVMREDDPHDPNHQALHENLMLLREARDMRGRPLRVVTLPMPAPVMFDGYRLPASYANFYIANGVVLVPTFNDPNDRLALNTIQELFPTRRVVGIHSLDLVLGLGTLHCMTQQQPARSLA